MNIVGQLNFWIKLFSSQKNSIEFLIELYLIYQ